MILEEKRHMEKSQVQVEDKSSSSVKRRLFQVEEDESPKEESPKKMIKLGDESEMPEDKFNEASKCMTIIMCRLTTPLKDGETAEQRKERIESATTGCYMSPFFFRVFWIQGILFMFIVYCMLLKLICICIFV